MLVIVLKVYRTEPDKNCPLRLISECALNCSIIFSVANSLSTRMEALLSAFRLFIFSSLILSNVDCEGFLEINDIIPITTNVSANDIEDECGAGEACVRFCCDNSTLCSNLDFFNKSSIAEAEDLDENFRILKGLPSCFYTVSAYEIDSNWSFLKVSLRHWLSQIQTTEGTISEWKHKRGSRRKTFRGNTR